MTIKTINYVKSSIATHDDLAAEAVMLRVLPQSHSVPLGVADRSARGGVPRSSRRSKLGAMSGGYFFGRAAFVEALAVAGAGSPHFGAH
ncbi:MAG: hypothetical protein OXN44_08880 [Acidimicrobiaceae bacterium]|nr:hypothetical protein [Acidimicrobiaceae bacterium]